MTIARELDIILAHGPELSAGGLDYYKLGLWAGEPAPQPDSLSKPRPAPWRNWNAGCGPSCTPTGPTPCSWPPWTPSAGPGISRLLTETFRSTPELISVVDLQEALGSPDPEACSLRAHHLIGVNASRSPGPEPITTQDLPVTSRVLVWGDSGAALKAAWIWPIWVTRSFRPIPAPGFRPCPRRPARGAPGPELQDLS